MYGRSTPMRSSELSTVRCRMAELAFREDIRVNWSNLRTVQPWACETSQDQVEQPST